MDSYFLIGLGLRLIKVFNGCLIRLQYKRKLIYFNMDSLIIVIFLCHSSISIVSVFRSFE